MTIPTNYIPCYLPNRAFGLELETSSKLPTPRGWSSVEDGSVSGLEYHSGPVLGQAGIDLVTSECNSLSADGEYVNEDCGYHIHLNARDLTEQQVSKFARFCSYYEGYYFALVRNRRHNESYCSRLPSAYRDIEDIAQFLYAGRPSRSQLSYKGHSNRCNWVNFHSYFFRGSIEVRLHHGVTRAQKVLNWAELMLKSLEFGAKTNWEEDKPYFWDMLAKAEVRESTIEYYRRRLVEYHGDIECVVWNNGRAVTQERATNAPAN